VHNKRHWRFAPSRSVFFGKIGHYVYLVEMNFGRIKLI